MPKQRREYKLYNEEIERTFTQHQTQITQLDSSISLQATTIQSVDGKVEEYYSKLVVADEGISTEVAKKVGADTIISTINQSAEAVTIDASKINLNGFVTFTNLAAYGDHTIALGDGSNTLTIDGSTITGTNQSGWIGYKLRPSSLDIYSFTSNNDLVGRLSATKSSKMGDSDVGVALFADQGDWITIGRVNSSGNVNPILHSNPSAGQTYLTREGDSYSSVSLTSGYNVFGLGGRLTYLQGSTIAINMETAPTNSTQSQLIYATPSGATFGNDSLPVTVHTSNWGICNGNTDYMRLSGAIWNIRGAGGTFAGPTTGTSKRGIRFDDSKVYVYNDTSQSTYIVLENNSINIYAQNGKIQMYAPGGRSVYFGGNGFMYTGTDGNPHFIQSSAGACE